MARMLLAAGLSAVLCVSAAASLSAEDEDRGRRREIMYGNFEALMNVMFLLSKREYTEAAKEVRTIEKHGEELAKPTGQPTLFHSYARSLKAHAENLRTLAEVLGAGGRPDPELEFLHDAAASDFGQIAATCVACHGHFLPEGKK